MIHTLWILWLKNSQRLFWSELRFCCSLFLKLTTCPTFSVRLVSQSLSQLYLYEQPTWRRALNKLRSNFWKLLYTSRNFDGVWVGTKKHTAARRHHPIPIPINSQFGCMYLFVACINVRKHIHMFYSMRIQNKYRVEPK